MISDKAIIDSSAKIAPNVEIGPFTVIGSNVTIDSGTVVGSHAVIKGTTKIGKNNQIFQFSSIGEDCQDKKYHGEDTILEIGDNNSFRENTTIHRGTVQGGGITKIGSNNLFMAGAHVAHDCIIGNDVIFANGASIAGHVEVADNAGLGGMVGVHQFCKIGEHSFTAGGSIIYKDILPYTMVAGVPAKANGLNTIGLQRKGFSKLTINLLQKAYRIIFRSSLTIKQVVHELQGFTEETGTNCIENLIQFLHKSERGITR